MNVCMTVRLSVQSHPHKVIYHKLTHESWQQWRDENPELVDKLKRDKL